MFCRQIFKYQFQRLDNNHCQDGKADDFALSAAIEVADNQADTAKQNKQQIVKRVYQTFVTFNNIAVSLFFGQRFVAAGV